MTDTDDVNGYEKSWYVYINMVFIYLGYAFASKKKFNTKPSYNIYIQETFKGCAEGAYGILVSGYRAVRFDSIQLPG